MNSKQKKWFKNIRLIVFILLLACAYYYPLNYFQIGLCIALALLVLPYPKPKKKLQLTIKLVLALVILAFGFYKNQTQDLKPTGEMSVYYLDVGQAESILLIFPDGKTGIIDAGSYENGPFVIQKMKELGFKDIDYMFVTHAHADHIGGMGDVVKEFNVGDIYMPYTPIDSSIDTFSYNHFLQEVNKKLYTIHEAKYGTVIDNGMYRIEVIYPTDAIEHEDLNQHSLILRILYNHASFLFTSDAGFYAEYNILQSDISADILKVGHHGSYDSTSQQFLSQVSPETAIICVGKDNPHNLPNNNVLNRLEELGINIYRTDINGTIIIKTDGNQYQIEKEH